ncbi:DUF3455 domain-containing protein [Nocardioides agariphilus]|uniref:DUF3455 domain-containing protein n=1 Tax=Nocardioides agariphilus TaxID=433664 RepID=A0A930VND6_9ACTN|nr:DUF3455 domain-containing protein [Nocardioides agariphilus]MBF4767737.1 DUF3455 domain-containing protein [Nocardioides agariphilus]
MKLPLSQPHTRLGAAAALAVIAMAAPAYAGPSSPGAPGVIAPPAGHKVFLVAHAEGVQIYTCNAATSAWALQAPRAQLYAQNGKTLGSHYLGPTWVANDGSYVVGRRVAGVNVDPSAIDWLLLEKDASGPGAGGDRLTGTTYVQRVNTVGGRAPAASQCHVPGETAEVEYSADYYFWKRSGS